MLVLCYIPTAVFMNVVLRFPHKMSLETAYIFFASVTTIVFLNSLINPIIYSVRIRQFRVAFIELTCRTVNIAEAEEIEMRFFGASNAVVTLKEGRERKGSYQQNFKQANI